MSDTRSFLKRYRIICRREEDANANKEDLLRDHDWKYSSDYPGSYWLWSKIFPESEVQWVWKGKVKVPHPGFTINGATTATALGIEAAWQDLWVRQ